jgi:ceramide glucosyltransferase
VARLARWLRVIRAQRPALLATYPLVLAPLPGQLLLAAALGAPALAALALAGRLVVALLARRASGLPLPGAALDALVADPLLLAAWLAALGSRRFRWRGVPLRIGPGGRLEAAR